MSEELQDPRELFLKLTTSPVSSSCSSLYCVGVSGDWGNSHQRRSLKKLREPIQRLLDILHTKAAFQSSPPQTLQCFVIRVEEDPP